MIFKMIIAIFSILLGVFSLTLAIINWIRIKDYKQANEIKRVIIENLKGQIRCYEKQIESYKKLVNAYKEKVEVLENEKINKQI